VVCLASRFTYPLTRLMMEQPVKSAKLSWTDVVSRPRDKRPCHADSEDLKPVKPVSCKQRTLQTWVTKAAASAPVKPAHGDKATPVNQVACDAYATMVTDGGIIVPVGRSTCGPVWATNVSADVTGDIWCYECGSKLYHRVAHTRSRCGIAFHVASHFGHYPSACCTGESFLHAAAKHAIVTHARALSFFHACTACKSRTAVDVLNGALEPKMEAAVDGFRADVGFLTPSGEVLGVVEILVTHEMGQVKRSRLTELGIAWCEVKGQAVLDAVRRSTFQVDVYTCALSIGRCHTCMAKAKEQARLQKAHELDKVRRAALDAEEQEAVTRRACQEVEQALQEARQSLQKRQAAFDEARQHLKRAEEELQQVRAAEMDLEWGAKDKEGVLTFGKYRGHHIQTVWTLLNDKAYIRFLEGYSGQFDSDRPDRAARHDHLHCISKDIMERAHKLLIGKCRRCFEPVRSDWQTWCTSCFRDLSQ
jgi:hypothetical protein